MAYRSGIECRRVAMGLFNDMQGQQMKICSMGRIGCGLRGAMLALLCASAVGCATTAPSMNAADAKRLADVSAVAGKPVSSFHFMSMSSFEPIGDSDLLVFTSPREAWLLHLDGPCRDLDFGPFLGLTSTFSRVSAGFDKVLVRGNPIACRIEQIRPVDTAVLKRVDRERRIESKPPGPAQAPGDQPPSG
jgi:hypothetical protein